MKTASKIDPQKLEALILKPGKHSDPDAGMCVMEAVAFFAREPFSDAPKCASPSVSGFLRVWNDALSDADRQMLKPLIAKLIGSRGTDAVEAKRYMLAFDWHVRVMTPTWLELAGLHEHAEALRELKPIKTLKQLKAAEKICSAAKSAAASAARSAARSAAWSAAWSAARSAAYSAAESAAASAAYSAARSAAESAARSAAESAAEEALAPTIKQLQQSAYDLVMRMLEVRS